MKYIYFCILMIFMGCASTKGPKDDLVVEQKVWHDDFREETVVTTKDDNSNVVSTVSTRTQSINMKEMDKLTQDRVDVELQRRKDEDMNFDDSVDKTVKVMTGIGKVVGAVLGTAIAVALEADK